ncbi:transglutaminase-like domain-containing protein [Planktothrix paucivesiculata]|uniref:Transglutaminase-like superfamily protein n=1 Tax=Planktothrix paucivesiculata PCC 9631 TaxID=671071 RepID=A0A7Z9BVX4_9CYAN|nr:transglutaminase family protein [Planktothrix paucivesiculata]VXD22376.1 Transglutaminase-like superfamily protein [Planktothrix paucivesiculata PCC 9631]
MKFKVGCQLEYEVRDYSTFIFNINVAKTRNQRILEESLKLDPNVYYEEYLNPVLGNRYLRINVSSGTLCLSYQAIVDVIYEETNPTTINEVPIAQLPLEILQYIYPSRYCQSDRLMRLAQSEFGYLVPDYSRITAICNWIYDNVIYLSGSSDQHTSAFDTVTERAGVCRDFAHLGIAFCRALNIPARFSSGYAYKLQPPDFHAYFEAYLGDRWYLFDATRLVPRNGLIKIGTGRDAADTAFATIFGDVEMTQMNVNVECLETISDHDSSEYTTQAISH